MLSSIIWLVNEWFVSNQNLIPRIGYELFHGKNLYDYSNERNIRFIIFIAEFR